MRRPTLSGVSFLTKGAPYETGGVTVENPLWLAPLAGITFGSFRLFHRSLGAGLVHTEMASALGLKYGGRKTRELLIGDAAEEPCVLQLFGAYAEDFKRGAEIALNIRRFAAVEVNMACPMPKVTKRGGGAALIENISEAGKIVSSLVRFGLPVWIKTRLAPRGAFAATEDFCGAMFESGASFIILHGRTPAQRYEGSASKELVGEVARKFPGRIGGSGDCFSPADFNDYLRLGCAAALGARGVLRDALLIPKGLKALGANVPEENLNPSAQYQARLLLELGRNIYNNEGEAFALLVAKRMLFALFKGFAGAPRLRKEAARAKSWRDMELLLREQSGVQYL